MCGVCVCGVYVCRGVYACVVCIGMCLSVCVCSIHMKVTVVIHKLVKFELPLCICRSVGHTTQAIVCTSLNAKQSGHVLMSIFHVDKNWTYIG